jgi:hypothetical protein
MTHRRRFRFAAWGALLAMALHALSPLAAPAPRDAVGSLHDICSSAPAAPGPVGDPSTSHCALCVVHASIAGPAVALRVCSSASHSQPVAAHATPGVRPTHPAANPRAPPASA